MAGASTAMSRRPAERPVDRVVAAFLLLVMAVGSLALWLLIPAAVLWSLAKLTESSSIHLVLGLAIVPAAMVVFAAALFWVNGLYLRVTGARYLAEDDDGQLRPLRGPLELILGWSLAAAAVVALAWLILHPIPQFSAGIG